ncbi:MAG TPA: hypothetical protein VGF94_08230 [Kofleriaceae bacterium]
MTARLGILAVVALGLLCAAVYLLEAGHRDARVGPDAGEPAVTHAPPQAAGPKPGLASAPTDAAPGDAAPPPSDDAAPPGSALARATAAYERQDYDEAMAIARDALAESPGDAGMLGVAVSSACARGDDKVAQQFYGQLPRDKRTDLRALCNRFGIALAD